MLKLITAPTELITVAEAAAFMRAEFSASETTLIESLITAARQMCEEYLFRRIGVQTVELRDSGFPAHGRAIILPAPLISVVSIKYIDGNNVEQTLASTEYLVSDSEPGKVRPVNSWPATAVAGDAISVRFSTGFSAPGESPMLSPVLPETIRTAMLMQIADMYENREAQVERPLSANPTLERLLSTWRLEMSI